MLKRLLIQVACVVGVILILLGIYHWISPKEEKPVETIPVAKITLTTDGNTTSENTADPVVSTEYKNTTDTNIRYVPKETINGKQETTDVEITRQPNHVYVKVNGKEHEITPTVKETQKFENGKLVVQEESKSVIQISAPKPAKWTASYYYGGNNKHGVGVGYALNQDVRLDGLYIDKAAYVGVTFSIGSMNAK